jgi:hypothetical protein
MVSVNGAVTEIAGVSLSVTVMLKVAADIAVVGVPESRPELLRVSPAGSVEPLATDQVYGLVPPVAVNCSLYAVPTVAFGSGEVVVMAKLVTVIVRPEEVPERPIESVTLIVTGNVPASEEDGVPVNSTLLPVLELRLIHAGAVVSE